MALTGMHVEFRLQKKNSASGAPVLGPLISSEDPATQTPTTGGAPAGDASSDPLVNLTAAADSYVSFGSSPADPSLPGTTRAFIVAKVPTPMIVNAGDKVRWVAA